MKYKLKLFLTLRHGYSQPYNYRQRNHEWTTCVFTGTRVPVESLFDHLEAGVSLDDFLEDFPSVSRQQAIDLLETANKILTSKNLEQLYAAVAG